MWAIWAALGWAENPYDGWDTNVVSERVIPSPEQHLFDQIANLQQVEALFPGGCTQDWVHGARSTERGASARVTYRAAAWRRRLTIVLADARPPRLLDYEHQGDRGFVTRFLLEAVDGGTRVTMTSYVAGPPWPFRRYYVDHVQPAWRDCHAGFLSNLERRAGSSR